MDAFKKYLSHAVISSYKASDYSDQEEWSRAVKNSDVRLQWDPDHDPYGKRMERKAIQIGLRKKFLSTFSREDILSIEDITPFVAEQHKFIKERKLNLLFTPKERPLIFSDIELNKRLQINNLS